MPERAVAVETTIAAPFATVWTALRDPVAIRRWHGWEYDERGGLDGEIDIFYFQGVEADEAAGTLTISDGSRFELEDRGAETVVRVTMPAPADSWDDVYHDVREGWTTFVHAAALRARGASRRGAADAASRGRRAARCPARRRSARHHHGLGRAADGPRRLSHGPSARPHRRRVRAGAARRPRRADGGAHRVRARRHGLRRARGALGLGARRHRRLRVCHRRAVHGAARRRLGALLVVEPLQRGADARIAAGELLDQPGPARDQRVEPRVGGVRAGRALGLHLGDQLGPRVLRAPHPLRAERVRARLELRKLLGRVVLGHPRHHLDRLDEPVARRLARVVEHVEDVREARPQVVREAQLLVDPRDVAAQRRPRVLALTQQRGADLLEREAHAAQGEDPVEPADVGVAVEAVARLRALRRHEQADRVVVVQRAYGQACGLRDRTDLQGLAHVHRGRR